MTFIFKTVPIIFLIAIVSACGDSTATAEKFGLAGTWETDLNTYEKGSKVHELKGRLEIADARFTYTWLERRTTKTGKTISDWTAVAQEDGNVAIDKNTMLLISENYAKADPSNRSQMREIGMPAINNDYLIEYEAKAKQLIWKEDYNLDGDFDDTFDFPETMIYRRIDE